MAEGLNAYLARTWDRPFVWGECDCTLWVADWCAERWGQDPAASFRGRYSTQDEAEALTAGGLLETIRPFMGFLVEWTEARPGDVGVVMIDGRETAAIRTENGWAVKSLAGMGEANMPALAIWGS
ncbi:hypothetical protein DRW48_10535 [Paracoccus suum]|uniref:DUF6950 domain-containing protein n=1 Tax=Paracoccus suum TaxID=2259340 RepID=A0A344PL16_9RHOB|nr:hypothetical protein [Paracoccus suum]AXC50071.1 hypothetical protein DRW48_10535 [Paracoccus suum]